MYCPSDSSDSFRLAVEFTRQTPPSVPLPPTEINKLPSLATARSVTGKPKLSFGFKNSLGGRYFPDFHSRSQTNTRPNVQSPRKIASSYLLGNRDPS